jgi:DNA-dependent metalloprotease WSS1
MTHGPLFWKTYGILKKEMAALDAKGYTGEGFYSRPYSLTSTVPISRPVMEEEIPEHICGGTWRRQKRHRKTGGRKRKFKGEGVKVGEDEEKRRELEGGKGNSKVQLPRLN